MTSKTELQYQQNSLLSAIITRTLQPNNHEVVRRLVKILGADAQSNVLVVADTPSQLKDVFRDLDIQSTHFSGDLRYLPYETAQFDVAIVAMPIVRGLHAVARELSRVLKPNGCLGMIVFSLYRDQMPDDTVLADQASSLLASGRPAAAYRAVLAECGFTAFVTEDRKRDVRRTALENYREYVLHGTTSEAPVTLEDVATQALGLIATGGIGIALITAEKGL